MTRTHPAHALRGSFLVASTFLLVGGPALAGAGFFTYTLEKVSAPSADELDAYARIEKAMDSAVGYYGTYTSIRKSLKVQYAADVPTADGSNSGSIRFGSSRSYMTVITAMHEIAHTLGVGTTAEYAALLNAGVVEGPKATAALRQITGDPTALLKGDSQHIWPYGLNYASEVKSAADLVAHARILEGLYQDMFHEKVVYEGRVRNAASGTCMNRVGTGLALGSCSDSLSLVRIVSMGDSNPTYRMEFGDRVLDTPNQSSATGLAMGLYTWNGGNHQRFRVSAGSLVSGSTVRLRMVHSGLELRSQAATVVQDALTASLDARTWELVTTTVSVTPRSMPARPEQRGGFDALGRHGGRPGTVGWTGSLNLAP